MSKLKTKGTIRIISVLLGEGGGSQEEIGHTAKIETERMKVGILAISHLWMKMREYVICVGP